MKSVAPSRPPLPNGRPLRLSRRTIRINDICGEVDSGQWAVEKRFHCPLSTAHYPPPASRNNLYRGLHRDHIEQFFYLFVFKRDASERPILNRSEQLSIPAAMNEDVPAESRVLRRLRPGANGAHYRLTLGLGDQAFFQSLVGVGDVGITDAQREVEFAAPVLVRDVIFAFGRRAVALFALRAGRVVPERDLIGLRQSLLPVLQDVQVKFALAF